MHRMLTTRSQFNKGWDGVTNFLMAGECAACLDIDLPPFADLLNIVRLTMLPASIRSAKVITSISQTSLTRCIS